MNWTYPEIFPLSSVSNKHTVLCNESGKYISYQSDKYGFNNESRVYEQQSKNTIVLIGDSFTQGWCVEPSDNIAGQMIKQKFQAINLGNGGSWPLFQYAILKEYAANLKPEIILWLYF